MNHTCVDVSLETQNITKNISWFFEDILQTVIGVSGLIANIIGNNKIYSMTRYTLFWRGSKFLSFWIHHRQRQALSILKPCLPLNFKLEQFRLLFLYGIMSESLRSDGSNISTNNITHLIVFLFLTIAIPILCSKKLSSIFNRLLVLLAIHDNLFIICR